MNLRELVATLEQGGKPEFSEVEVTTRAPDGRVHRVESVDFTAERVVLKTREA